MSSGRHAQADQAPFSIRLRVHRGRQRHVADLHLRALARAREQLAGQHVHLGRADELGHEQAAGGGRLHRRADLGHRAMALDAVAGVQQHDLVGSVIASTWSW